VTWYAAATSTKYRYCSDQSTLSSTTNAGYSATTPTLPPRHKGTRREGKASRVEQVPAASNSLSCRTDNHRPSHNTTKTSTHFPIPEGTMHLEKMRPYLLFIYIGSEFFLNLDVYWNGTPTSGTAPSKRSLKLVNSKNTIIV